MFFLKSESIHDLDSKILKEVIDGFLITLVTDLVFVLDECDEENKVRRIEVFNVCPC